MGSNKAMPRVFVSGSFDDLKSRHVRFLQEAARLGSVHICLWSDQEVARLSGKPPKFSEQERQYLLKSLRYVQAVSLTSVDLDGNRLPLCDFKSGDCWVVDEASDTPQQSSFCEAHDLQYTLIRDAELAGYPRPLDDSTAGVSNHKKVVVTGCFDWFHSGHVRFFEEVSSLGDLYVVVGSDENVRLLKGSGHPLIPQDERCYMVQAVRFVRQALISTGSGWMDAAPEIERIKPDIYAMNEDGDRPEKREFCRQHHLEYAILKRLPKEGLPRRQSTDLRRF
jgi:cytidyltransferase-like protein